MDARPLFQLGTTDLGSGAAQTEGSFGWDARQRARIPSSSENTAADAAERVETGVAGPDAPHAEAEHAPSATTPTGLSVSVDAPDAESDLDHFIERDGQLYAGTHLIIEVSEADGLDDMARIETAFRDCVDACGATLLHLHLHRFTPQGVSGVAVLAESHISVHTWPERRYGAFDVFMCGDADPHAAVPVLKRAFNAGSVAVQELLRGAGLVDPAEALSAAAKQKVAAA